MSKDKQMTTEQHREVGMHLREAEKHLLIAHKLLRAHYYKTGTVMRLANKVCLSRDGALTDLRLLLEKEEGVTTIGELYFQPFNKEDEDKIFY